MKAELTLASFDDLVKLMTEIKGEYDKGTDLRDTDYAKKTQDVLNQIFGAGSCYSMYLTNNIDRPMFGVRISPIIGQKEAIDIIMIDRNNRVIYYKKSFPKWKILIKKEAYHTIELPNNSISNININDKLTIS